MGGRGRGASGTGWVGRDGSFQCKVANQVKRLDAEGEEGTRTLCNADASLRTFAFSNVPLCRYRSARIVHSLLRRGARMTRDRSGATVLHKAAANRDPSVLRLLLQEGAAPYLRDLEGRCPLATALLLGNQEAAQVLLEELSRCHTGYRDAQLCRLKWQASVRYLNAAKMSGPSAGAELRPDDSGSRVSSCWLARCDEQQDSMPVVSIDNLPDEAIDLILLAAMGSLAQSESSNLGSACTVEPSQGVLPTRRGILPVTGLNTARDTQPSARDRTKAATAQCTRNLCSSPAALLAILSRTSSRFRSACRRFELTRWTSVQNLNASIVRFHPRWQHTTLLHLAAAHGMEEVAEKLLRRGASVDVRDSLGLTPVEEARMKNQPILVALLLSWGNGHQDGATIPR